VSDHHRVVGLNLASGPDRERFVTGIQNAVRDRIRPNPFIDVGFEKVDEGTVARIFVPRGDQPLYCCDGRPCIREGPQGVVADGMKVAKIVMEFA
jgi:predicted HTH transcriptional regulator